MRPPLRFGLVTVAALAALAFPPSAWAHGGEEEEMEGLTMQPARTLAQQALAELKVRGDTEEAAVRLDAALESEDQSDIDVKVLNQATETLDGGDPDAAIPLLDEALSRPLGEESGQAEHEAGREFQPGTDTQEVVAIILGAMALLAGAALLAHGARSRGSST
jgi:hypothetical protein